MQKEEKAITDAAWALCDAIASGKLGDYLEILEKKPKQEIINDLLDIIHTKDSFLPILSGKETAPELIDGIAVDSRQNRMGRIDTLVSLLIVVKEESKKLGIWNKIKQEWKEKYKKETDLFIRYVEMMIEQTMDTQLFLYLADYKLKVKEHMNS
jgi:hypothetical protein